MSKTKHTVHLLTLAIAMLLLLTACEVAAPAGDANSSGAGESTEGSGIAEPETIKIGNPIALSGPWAGGAMMTQIRSYDLWAADVNANGGIYVAEYDKRIPVEIIRYDDTSEMGNVVQLTEKLILEDKVHFLLPPWGTGANFAVAPIINQYEMPLIGCTVSSLQLQERAAEFPYFFVIVNQFPDQGAALIELTTELGVETAAMIHHTDLHGIEFSSAVLENLKAAGVDVVLEKTYPPHPSDLSQVLREVQAAGVDALIAASYPSETFLMTRQMQEIGFNPKMFYTTVAIAFPAYRDTFGAETIEGVMGAGVWSPTIPVEGAREYFDRHVEMHGEEPDRWASAACYSTGQVLEQAVEAAGSLDPQAVTEAISSTEFNTILGPVSFEDQYNTYYPGQVGQWQNGEFEVIAPADQRTQDPIFPKPEWGAGE